MPSSDTPQPERIRELNEQLARENASWRAKDTSVSRIAPERFARMLGWTPSPRPRALTESPVAPHLPSWSPTDPSDPEVDWRKRNGKNYVTSVKGQGGCGTCVSFAVCAQVESIALIEKGVELDLSEADLAFNGTHLPDCTGWEQGLALADVKAKGVVSERRLPYDSVFVPTHDSWSSPPSAHPVGDKNAFAAKVATFANLHDNAERKSYLTHVGPLTAGITAYDDFATYGTGVYSPSSSARVVGGHCILVIGYSEAKQSWLIKNSWGADWGESGFGEIAFGACAIDTQGTYYTSCGGVSIPEGLLDETIDRIGNAILRPTAEAAHCDGFYSDDDGMRHVITGTTSGDIVETFFHPTKGTGQSKLLNVPGLQDVGSFYTGDDTMRHVVALTDTGAVSEVYFSPKHGVSSVPLGTFSGANRVSGFYSSDDRLRHAIVGLASGDVLELFFGAATGHSRLATIPHLMDIGSFYSPDDQFRHVIAAALSGTITEIFYHPTKGNHSTVLATIPGVRRVSACYAPATPLYSRRVLVLYEQSDALQVCELRYSSESTVMRNELGDFTGAVDLGAFFTADDRLTHCVLASTGGKSTELFY